jgi:hypothetical protein
MPFTPLVSDSFAAFDAKIDQCLSVLAGANRPVLPRPAQILRALPQAKGGLAIARISELAPYAFTASFTAAAASLAQKCPALASQLLFRAQDLRPVMELARDIAPPHFTAGDADSGSSECVPRCWAPPSGTAPSDSGEEATEPAVVPEAPRQRELAAALSAAHR